MKMKHTRGPWHWSGDSLTHRSFQIYSPYGGVGGGQTHICTTNDLPHSLLVARDVGEAMANARLIAAAPELLQALKRVLSSIPITGTSTALAYDIRDAARAIAKAEGRTE